LVDIYFLALGVLTHPKKPIGRYIFFGLG